MKKVKRIIIFILALGILYGVIVTGLMFSGKQSQPEPNADTMLILGAQVKGDPAYPSTSLKERLDAAIPYLNENLNTHVIVCGGQGSDESDSEANVMANYLIERGISESRITKEDTSTRTKENIANAMAKQSLGKTVIVTNDFHMYRAMLLGKRLGISDISGLPGKSNNSATVAMNLREILALGYGLIFDW